MGHGSGDKYESQLDQYSHDHVNYHGLVSWGRLRRESNNRGVCQVNRALARDRWVVCQQEFANVAADK